MSDTEMAGVLDSEQGLTSTGSTNGHTVATTNHVQLEAPEPASVPQLLQFPEPASLPQSPR